MALGLLYRNIVMLSVGVGKTSSQMVMDGWMGGGDKDRLVGDVDRGKVI